MKDLDQLKSVHEQLKNHMWRRNGRAFDSYAELFKKLIDLFYEALKEDYAKTNTPIPYVFFHDNMECINGVRFYPDKLSQDMKSDCLAAVDSAIGTIHLYIETGKFNSFMTYYRSSNPHKKKSRWTHWTLHEKRNRFDWHPKYKDIVIEDYETALKSEKIEKYIKEYEEELAYWRSL